MAQEFSGFLKCIVKNDFAIRPTIIFMLDIVVGLF